MKDLAEFPGPYSLDEIKKNKGILYDPEVVDAGLRLIREKEYMF